MGGGDLLSVAGAVWVRVFICCECCYGESLANVVLCSPRVCSVKLVWDGLGVRQGAVGGADVLPAWTVM